MLDQHGNVIANRLAVEKMAFFGDDVFDHRPGAVGKLLGQALYDLGDGLILMVFSFDIVHGISLRPWVRPVNSGRVPKRAIVHGRAPAPTRRRDQAATAASSRVSAAARADLAASGVPQIAAVVCAPSARSTSMGATLAGAPASATSCAT